MINIIAKIRIGIIFNYIKGYGVVSKRQRKGVTAPCALKWVLRRFESCLLHKLGAVAEWQKQGTVNPSG